MRPDGFPCVTYSCLPHSGALKGKQRAESVKLESDWCQHRPSGPQLVQFDKEFMLRIMRAGDQFVGFTFRFLWPLLTLGLATDGLKVTDGA